MAASPTAVLIRGYHETAASPWPSNTVSQLATSILGKGDSAKLVINFLVYFGKQITLLPLL